MSALGPILCFTIHTGGPITKRTVRTLPARRAAHPKKPAARKVAPEKKGGKEASPEVAFPVVGLGASAGGLEALEAFFGHMPANSGMAFVVVTHQHPGHTSMLAELLGRTTEMPVVEAARGTRVQPNHVYVSPPSVRLGIVKGRLRHEKIGKGESIYLPIDHFFRSLAADLRENAICIILSGTGTDGTLGLKAIKGESGMAMVQKPTSAQYGGMPSSAAATGLADYTLPPEEMAKHLQAYVHGHHRARSGDAESAEATEPLRKILTLLQSRTGNDFSKYKTTTIRRRIERRMNLHQVKGPNAYARYLLENPHEVDVLFKELLIGVTSFFRDPAAFDVLAQTAIPDLIASRPDDRKMRVWVPGCATGEEAYSLAITFRECIEESKRPLSAHIFGTDLDSESIDIARTGHYPEGISADIQPSRLERFFLREENAYRIRKDIRETAIFAAQNLIKDPPFTRLDMISCRNLLIYLDADIHKKIIPLFHYALKPGGILFLGPSETIGMFHDLFEPVDKKWKIFRRKPSGPASQTTIAFSAEMRKGAPPAVDRAGETPTEGENIAKLVDRMLLARFAPASVVVNRGGEVVFIHGRTGAYLEPASGQPRLNIHDMAREGLDLELAAALQQATKQNAEVRREGVRVRTNGGFSHVDIHVMRIAEPEALRGLLLITFHPSRGPEARSGSRRAAKGGEHRIKEIERQLRFAKESLQTTIEELETSNEELKSSNEELQSTNEELQSTNEELETSKEEMQSLNEELTTVNAELNAKVEDLSRANDDMLNLLNSTEIATIFLDPDLNISRYTEQARRIVNLIPTDVGRPLSHLVPDLRYDRITEDCREVLASLVFKQAEVQTKDGRWFLMRIMPYRTAENVIDGLVLTFVDINPIKKAEQALGAEKERADWDLQAMTRLQAIAAVFIRDVGFPAVLDQVLDTALFMTNADMGAVQLLDPRTGNVRVAAHRGMTPEWLEFWASTTKGGAHSAALDERKRIIIGDIEQHPALAGTREREIHAQAGARAMQFTPLLGRKGQPLGLVSTYFRTPHVPDERSLRLLDLIARLTAEILDHKGGTPE